MQKVIHDFTELEDSRELLQAREPGFIIVITFLMVLLLLAAGIWLWMAEIDVVVRAEGIVRPLKSVSIIRSIYGGRITGMYCEQGEQVSTGEVLLVTDTAKQREKKENIAKRIRDITAKMDKLSLLREFILHDVDYPEQENIYYNRYLLYKTEYRQLMIALLKAEDRYNREKKLSSFSTSASKLKELKLNFEQAELNLSKFKKEKINNINSEINNLQIELLDLENLLIDLNERINAGKIRSPISGTVEIIQKLNTGDYIPSGLQIVKIVPQSQLNYKMMIMVKNRDISKLKQGQQIKYRFHALPYREYGVLNGKITEIACDTKAGEASSDYYYEIEGSIYDNKLMSNNGKSKNIKNGMLSEVRIVTGRKKIIYFILEKLDFLD